MSRDILLDLIDPDPNQPRQYFDEAKLVELAQSIKNNGLAVPILLRPNGDRFVIIHGERRVKATLSLGWDRIPAEVRDIDPTQARWLSLVENIQRADLSPIEEAKAFQETLTTVDGLTQKALAERVGKTQSYIAQKLRLLKLPGEIRSNIDNGKITEGHGRQLLRTKDPEEQERLADRVVTNNLSVATLEKEVTASRLLSDFPPADLYWKDLVEYVNRYDIATKEITEEYEFNIVRKFGKLLAAAQRWFEREPSGFVEWQFSQQNLAKIESLIYIEPHLNDFEPTLADVLLSVSKHKTPPI